MHCRGRARRGGDAHRKSRERLRKGMAQPRTATAAANNHRKEKKWKTVFTKQLRPFFQM